MEIPYDFKSRLVGRGDFENLDGVRTDSPTQDCSGHLLICSYAASNDLRIKTADISNAYFQGKELDRVLLLNPPRDGPLLVEDESGNLSLTYITLLRLVVRIVAHRYPL